ncbi:MAG: SURF1 family protein [Alphaproteobacteria bacterium]|nr:SURF1 family protein [Alphaproteobacteria bacterium]
MASGRRFRPTFWPTLFTVPALMVLVGLGAWQVERLNWKNSLVETFDSRIAMAPVGAPTTIENMDEWRYRRVELVGVFQHGKEILITGRPFEGSAGFHVLTPFLLGDDRIIIVNRGWVPEKLRAREKRPETLVEGLVTVLGIIREDRRRGAFVPDNEPHNEVWLYVDTDQMASHRDIVPVAPYYVDAIRDPGPYTLPIGASAEIAVRNEHLQYAVTWFLLAGTLLVIYVIYHFRRPEDEAGSEIDSA